MTYKTMIFIVLSGSLCQASNTPISLSELKRIIAEEEKKLLNIEVQATFRAERWEPKSSQWVFAGEAEAVSYFPNSPGSKMRIDFHRHKIPWEDGAAPFTEDVYSISYNGRFSQSLYFKTGAANAPYTTLRGEVDKERPNIKATGVFVSGWQFSNYGFGDTAGKRLSEMLNESEDVQFTIKQSVFDGRDCIELIAQKKGADTLTRLYFDPKRRYAILGYETVKTSGEIKAKTVVEAFEESSEGIFYPIKGCQYIYGTNNQPIIKKIYHATKVIMNNPKFSDSIFTIEWPEGTIVHDKIADITLYIGKGYNDLPDFIKSQINEVHEVGKTMNVHNSEPHESNAEMVSSIEERNNHSAACAEKKGNKRGYVIFTIAGGFCFILMILLKKHGHCILGKDTSES